MFETLCRNFPSNVKSCSVTVVSIGGQSQNPLDSQFFMWRFLQSTNNALIEFLLILTAICNTSDCSDADTLGNELYDQAGNELQSSIDSGTLHDGFANMSAGNLKDILASANITGSLNDIIVSPATAAPTMTPTKKTGKSSKTQCTLSPTTYKDSHKSKTNKLGEGLLGYEVKYDDYQDDFGN